MWVRTFKLYIVYKYLKMFYILDFFINLCLVCQRWSWMLKTIQQNKFHNLSTMINYGNIKKYKKINWVLQNTNVLVITAMGLKFYSGQQLNNTYENLVMMICSLNLYWWALTVPYFAFDFIIMLVRILIRWFITLLLLL